MQPLAFIDLQAQQARIGAQIGESMTRVVRHGQFILGPEVEELENELAAFCGAPHCISCANGTDAIILVLMVEGIGPGDAVLVPSFTFVATAESVATRGATPVMVDVDPTTFNIDIASLERGIAFARQSGLRTRMIIAVDLFGQPANYDALRTIADAHKMILVSDAAQSFGAELRGRKVGTLADYTTTSFFPSKPLGCYGDGGAIFTPHAQADEVLRSFRMHGRGRDKYDNIRIGLNSRLDTLQAAVLLEKLKVFKEEVAQRQVVAGRYGAKLANVVLTPSLPPESTSVWAQYTVLLPEGCDRDKVRQSMNAAGVPTAVYYPLSIHQQAGYLRFPRDPVGLPQSEMLSRRVLSLPMHAYLDPDSQERVVDALRTSLDV